MGRNPFFIHVLCFVLLSVVTNSGDGHTSDRAYDLDGVFRKSASRLENMLKYRSETSGHQIKYPSLENILLDHLQYLYQNSSKCREDLNYTLENLMTPWALQMLDSYGKPSSGIMRGNTKWMGDFDECTQVEAPPSRDPNSTAGNFRGKYCSLRLSVTVANFSFSVASGACIPSSCHPPEIHSNPGPLPMLINEKEDISNETKPILKVLEFKCKPTERKLNSGVRAVIALLAIFTFLMILGSSVTAFKYFQEKMIWPEATLIVNSTEHAQIVGHSDSLKKKDLDSGLEYPHDTSSNDLLKKCLDFLDCFCIFKNGAKLLNTDTREGELLCIHGIRFLSMSWVILGHTYVMSIAEISNMLDVLNVLSDFAFQVVLQGGHSVDSFFVLSGFLLTYLALQEFSKKNGGIFWPYFYIHRYIRLTPVYMLILGFSATVYFYLGSGPFWPDGDYDPICKENWWWNLLYINNFPGADKQCMAWSWYLANDMQFFIISPLFLITLWRWPKLGYSLIGVFLFTCAVANFSITYYYDLPCGMNDLINYNVDKSVINGHLEFFDKVYIKPYTRIGPYLIGILLGYILFTRKANNEPKHSWVFLLVGWVVASFVTLACIYGLYKATPSLVAKSFYNALHRTLFAMGLSWVIYVCLIGQGGFLNSILSYKLFIPLSRLTYVVYLIHPMIITGYFVSLKTSLYFAHSTMVLLFFGMLVMSYSVALPVTLVLESPVISLEKWVRNSFKKVK